MGYLLCKKCGKYYKLQPGESLGDFVDKCECGGELEYLENIDGKFLNSNKDQYMSIIGVSSTTKIGLGIFVALFIILTLITVFTGRMSDLGGILIIFLSVTTVSSVLLLYKGKKSFRKARPLNDRGDPQIQKLLLIRRIAILIIGGLVLITEAFPNTVLLLNSLNHYIFFILYLMILLLVVLSAFYYLRYMKRWI